MKKFSILFALLISVFFLGNSRIVAGKSLEKACGNFSGIDECLLNRQCGWCLSNSTVHSSNSEKYSQRRMESIDGGNCVQIFSCGPYFSENCPAGTLLTAGQPYAEKCSMVRYFSYHQFISGFLSGAFTSFTFLLLLLIILILIRRIVNRRSGDYRRLNTVFER